MLQLLGHRIVLERQADDTGILDEMDPVHFERRAIDEPAVDGVDRQLQRMRKRLRPQANRMIVVAMDENSVRADPPGRSAAADRGSRRSRQSCPPAVLGQEPRAIVGGDLQHAVVSAKLRSSERAKDFAIAFGWQLTSTASASPIKSSAIVVNAPSFSIVSATCSSRARRSPGPPPAPHSVRRTSGRTCSCARSRRPASARNRVPSRARNAASMRCPVVDLSSRG